MVKIPPISEPVGAGTSSKRGAKPIGNSDRDVRSIQTMLKSIPADQGGTPNLEVNGRITGPNDPTVKAIRKFQQKKFGWQDGVVDPKSHTETSLQALAGGTDPPPEPAKKPLDIIVRFTGGPGGERRDEDREKDLRLSLNSDQYLETHQPIEAICFTGFREQEKFVSVAVADVLRRRAETSNGVTIVIGSSAGGMSAIQAARQLTAKQIHLDYVGINDAAFLSSKNEVIFEPFSINIGGGVIQADLKENFFQTLGHNFQRDSKGFFPHAEFHGPLQGFTNINLNDKPRVKAVAIAFGAAEATASPFPLPVAVKDRFAATIHRQAGGTVENLIGPRIAQLVKP